MRQIGWRFTIKRAFDRAAAAAGLVVASPVLAASALAIRATMGSPVLFRQQRPGLQGEPFVLVKFRTMREAHNSRGAPLPDGQRLTGVGRFLRRTSIDELPQLINVLRGELSLVGPRPLLMKYLSLYSPDQARRHDVMPGLTGWAQVHGRNATTWARRFELDTWYVDNWSLLLDGRILARTVIEVLRGSGVENEGHATMPEFTGKT